MEMLVVIVIDGIDRNCLFKVDRLKFDGIGLFKIHRNIFDKFNFGSAKTKHQVVNLISTSTFPVTYMVKLGT